MAGRATTWPMNYARPTVRIRSNGTTQSLGKVDTGTHSIGGTRKIIVQRDGNAAAYYSKLRAEVGDDHIWRNFFRPRWTIKEASKPYCSNTINLDGKRSILCDNVDESTQAAVAINPELGIVLQLGEQLDVDPAFFVKYALGRRSNIRGSQGFWYTLDLVQPDDECPILQFAKDARKCFGQVWIYVPYPAHPKKVPLIVIKFTGESDRTYRPSWQAAAFVTVMKWLQAERIEENFDQAQTQPFSSPTNPDVFWRWSFLTTPLLNADEGHCAEIYQFFTKWLLQPSHVELLHRLPWPEEGPVTQSPGTMAVVSDLGFALNMDLCVSMLGRLGQQMHRLSEAAIFEPTRATSVRLNKCRGLVAKLKNYVRDFGPQIPESDICGWAIGKPQSDGREMWWLEQSPDQHQHGDQTRLNAPSDVETHRSIHAREGGAASVRVGALPSSRSHHSISPVDRGREAPRQSGRLLSPSSFHEWTLDRVDQHREIVLRRLSSLEIALEDVFQLLSQAVTVADSEANTRQARRATFLTLLAVIYLPATLATGMMGMNIQEITNEATAPSWRTAVYIWLTLVAVTALFILLRLIAKARHIPWVFQVGRWLLYKFPVFVFDAIMFLSRVLYASFCVAPKWRTRGEDTELPMRNTM